MQAGGRTVADQRSCGWAAVGTWAQTQAIPVKRKVDKRQEPQFSSGLIRVVYSTLSAGLLLRVGGVEALHADRQGLTQDSLKKTATPTCMRRRSGSFASQELLHSVVYIDLQPLHAHEVGPNHIPKHITGL